MVIHGMLRQFTSHGSPFIYLSLFCKLITKGDFILKIFKAPKIRNKKWSTRLLKKESPFFVKLYQITIDTYGRVYDSLFEQNTFWYRMLGLWVSTRLTFVAKRRMEYRVCYVSSSVFHAYNVSGNSFVLHHQKNNFYQKRFNGFNSN